MIRDLVQELCPGGVEFKTLGDVGKLIRGNGLQKNHLTDAGVPAIHYGQIHTIYGTWATEAVSFVTPEFAKRLRKAMPGDLVIATTSEDDEAVGKAVAWLGAAEAAVGGDAFVYRHTLNPKFVSYFFQSEQFRNQKRTGITGTKVRRISGDKLAKIKIPVPPKRVQDEVVRVLDLFSGAVAGLKAELDAESISRRLQHAYYRDNLFTFHSADVYFVPMGEVGDFIRGRRFTKSDVVSEGIPSIHYGEIYTTYGIAADQAVSHVREDLGPQLRYAKPGDVVIAAVGETVEDVGRGVAWLGAMNVAIHDDCFLYRSNVLDPKFVSYYLRTDAHTREKAKYVARAKVKRMSSEGLAKLPIPVPPLKEQKRIVAILDKLNSLTADMAVALPAEASARRQQYEFYRDRLLAFDELPA
ncbi:restriction endonuclease subunit S [Verrucosispora sp. WMMD573]|uniref:restriction endonuclease subunit S n=1 Tax=Verrucosispora sp. WMMD573 TaxID=3015149 RepID=UPI00248CC738|nr:restriction endonuclease subunit S [Verrucosispora sp. WMMD573]WBB57577.1 restriction endonuclease subunit S [Verrucosispora sp. WMMD573]